MKQSFARAGVCLWGIIRPTIIAPISPATIPTKWGIFSSILQDKRKPLICINSLYFSNNSLYSHFFVDTIRHFVDYYLRGVCPLYYIWDIIKQHKNTNTMKNLTLHTQEQVKSSIEHFLKISGNTAIDIDNMSLYLMYVKGLILGCFEGQKVEFNTDDFFKMYILYTDNVLKCKLN